MAHRRFTVGMAGLMIAMGSAMVAGSPAGAGGAPAAAGAPLPSGPAFVHHRATPLPNGFKAIEVDAATERIFVSSPASSVVTVLGLDGSVQDSITVPGAGALLLDGPTLYVAATTAGRIDSFSTSTLVPTGSYGAGAIVKPSTLAKAGGRVWTTTGECTGSTKVVSFVPGAAKITVHPPLQELWYCPQLYSSPVDPNLMIAFNAGLGPATAVRLDVSSGAPVEAASLWDVGNYSADLEFMPDGQTFALASPSPYEIPTFRVNPLERHGVVYPTGHYPNAVEATSAAGGLLAAGRSGTYTDDIDVFRLGDPSQTIFRYDFGATSNTLRAAGLAFSPDGARLFAVSGDDVGTAMLNVFGPPDAGGRYHPLAPARILDTRDQGTAGRVGPQAVRDVQVTGRGGIPAAGASAVALNVTVTQPTATSFLALFPAGTLPPLASNLNFVAGQTIPNLVVVKVSADGKISMLNAAGATHVILDVAGWYSSDGDHPAGDGRYTPLVPSRLLDTRVGGGRLGPNASLDLQVTGRGGVPATGAMAAVLNVTATATTATSFVTVHPSGVARPLASNLNFNAGESVSNRVMATLGKDGKVTIYNLAGFTDIVVDLSGWYSDASVPVTAPGMFMGTAPFRVLDTRDGTGGVVGPLAGGTAATLSVVMPDSPVHALVLNATVVDPTGPGFLTIFPSGGGLPLASDVNYAGGETRPNLTVVQVGEDGKIVLYTSTTAHVILDVAGWFS